MVVKTNVPLLYSPMQKLQLCLAHQYCTGIQNCTGAEAYISICHYSLNRDQCQLGEQDPCTLADLLPDQDRYNDTF